MATQREIIYAIKKRLRGGDITDDDAVLDRQVAFESDVVRELLLRQQYNKGQNLSDNNVQTIACMEMELVDQSLMPDFPSGCSIYRTVLDFPSVLESKGKDLITGVSGPKIGAITYDIIPYARLPYAESTKFKRPIITRFNNKLYLINGPFTINITVSGVFGRPGDLSNYNNCEGQPCFSWDSNYPMSGHLIPILEDMVVERLLPKTLTDKTNSGAHELESQVNPNAQAGQKGQG